MILSKLWEIMKDRQAWSAPFDGVTKSWTWLGDWITAKQSKQESCFQFSLVTQSCLTLCDPMDHSMPGFPVNHQLLEFTQTHVYRVGDAIQPSHPRSSPPPPAFKPSIFPSIRSFPVSQFWTSGGQHIGASASASVLSIEYSGLISFRMDWLDRLAVQGMLKSLLQHHSSKASVLQCPAFIMVHLSHSYLASGKKNKNIALTRWMFIGKVMSF